MLADATKDAIRAAYARLKDGLPGFRARASQGQDDRRGGQAFGHAGGVAVIEAPTGTGKSMAYLIAGVEVARCAEEEAADRHRHRGAAGTAGASATFPLYLKLNGSEAKVAMAKGRGRYLCPRNLRMAADSLGDSGQMGLAVSMPTSRYGQAARRRDKQVLRKLTDAFDRDEWNGDMDAAPETPGDMLRADGDHQRRRLHRAPLRAIHGLPVLCRAPRGGRCRDHRCQSGSGAVRPHHAGRDDADNWGGVILPKPDDTLYVFDEAHHMPGKTIDRGASDVPLGTAVRQISRLGRQVHAAYSLTDKEVIGKLDARCRRRKTAGAQRRAGRSGTGNSTVLAARSRPRPSPCIAVRWANCRRHGCSTRRCCTCHVRMQRWLTAVRRTVTEMSEGGPTQEALSRELGMALERIDRQVRTWRAWSSDDPEQCAATGALGHAFERSATRLSCVGRIRRRIVAHDSLGQRQRAMMTSATLSAGGNFRGFADAVGLPDDAVTMSLPSPFDLAAQARLEVPAMRTLPDAREAHAEEISEWLAEQPGLGCRQPGAVHLARKTRTRAAEAADRQGAQSARAGLAGQVATDRRTLCRHRGRQGQHLVRSGLVRRRPGSARQTVRDGGDHPAAVRGADRSGRRHLCRMAGIARAQPVHRSKHSRSNPPAHPVLRPPDSQRNRPWSHRAAGSAHRHQALRQSACSRHCRRSSASSSAAHDHPPAAIVRRNRGKTVSAALAK